MDTATRTSFKLDLTKKVILVWKILATQECCFTELILTTLEREITKIPYSDVFKVTWMSFEKF